MKKLHTHFNFPRFSILGESRMFETGWYRGNQWEFFRLILLSWDDEDQFIFTFFVIRFLKFLVGFFYMPDGL